MKFFVKNKNAIIYALIMSLCFLFLYQTKNTHSIQELIFVILISLVIFTFEVYIVLAKAKLKLKQLGIPAVRRYSKLKETLYHKFIPSLAFLSLFNFIYFNPISSLLFVFIILTFTIFFLLFVNIRSYYEDKFNLELSTHFIYPLILIFSIFSLTNTFLNLSNIYSLPLLILWILILLLNITITNLMIIDELPQHIKIIILLIFASLISTILVVLLFSYFGSSLRSSFISAILAYFCIATIYHKNEGTFNKELLLEYLSILMLCLIIFYGVA